MLARFKPYMITASTNSAQTPHAFNNEYFKRLVLVMGDEVSYEAHLGTDGTPLHKFIWKMEEEEGEGEGKEVLSLTSADVSLVKPLSLKMNHTAQ